MRLVKQEDPFGCGVTCIAFILKINYHQALTLFKDGKIRAKEKPNFYCREMVMILNHSGLKYQYKYLKKRLLKKIYQPNTIVFIKRSKKYPFGHYLIRANRQWMDPLAGFRTKLPGKPIYEKISHIFNHHSRRNNWSYCCLFYIWKKV